MAELLVGWSIVVCVFVAGFLLLRSKRDPVRQRDDELSRRRAELRREYDQAMREAASHEEAIRLIEEARRK